MEEHTEFTNEQVNQNNRRTIKQGLFSNLNKEQLNKLIDSYFRDENGYLHCAYTGKIIHNKNKLALEHMVPVNRKGSSVIFNVCPALTNINSSKSDDELLLWWKAQSFYDVDRLRNLTMYILEAYDVFFKNHDIVIDETEDSGNINEESQENNSNEATITEQELEQIDYSSFLNSLISELEDHNITLDEIDINGEHDINYKQIYDEILSNNYFKDCKEKEQYQRIMLKYLNIYAKDRKYTIATNINYKEVYENINKMLEKQKTKEEDKERIIDYIIHSRITFLRNIITNKINSTDTAILETIIDMPELLYKPEEEFTDEYINIIKDNLPMNKEIKFQYLLEFYKEKGRRPKVGKEMYKGVDIGGFLYNIRKGDTKLTSVQMETLEEIDPVVFKNLKEAEVNRRIQLLIEYAKAKKENKAKYIWPTRNEEYQGENIGEMLHSTRKNIRKNENYIKEEYKKSLLELDQNVFKNQQEIKDILAFDLLIEYAKSKKENKQKYIWPDIEGENYKKRNIGKYLRKIIENPDLLKDDQKQIMLELDSNAFKDNIVELQQLKYESLVRYKTNKEKMLKAIAINSEAFELANKELQENPEFFIASVKITPEVLQYDNKFKNEEDMILKVIEVVDNQDIVWNWINTQYKKQGNKVLESLIENGLSLSKISDRIDGYKDLAIKAVQNDPNNIEFVPLSLLLNNKDIVVEAAKGDVRILKYVEQKSLGIVNNNPVKMMEIIKYDPSAFQFIGDKLKANESFVLEVIKQSPEAITYIDSNITSKPELMEKGIQEEKQVKNVKNIYDNKNKKM